MWPKWICEWNYCQGWWCYDFSSICSIFSVNIAKKPWKMNGWNSKVVRWMVQMMIILFQKKVNFFVGAPGVRENSGGATSSAGLLFEIDRPASCGFGQLPWSGEEASKKSRKDRGRLGIDLFNWNRWMFPKIVGFPLKSSILIGFFHSKSYILIGFSIEIARTRWFKVTFWIPDRWRSPTTP